MTIPFQATVLLTYRDGRVEERVFPIESIRSNFVYLDGGEEFGEQYGPFCISEDNSPEHQEGAFQCQPPPSAERLTPESVIDCRTWQSMTCANLPACPAGESRGFTQVTEEDMAWLQANPPKLLVPTVPNIVIEDDPEPS